MKGGKNRQPLGYTIIEVMIVLAVSGIMFLIAAQFINGKQERTSFIAGVNQMASNIQDVIEQVTDGQYSDIPLNNCTAPSVISGQVSFLGATQAQGTNSDCVFLGKMFHFSVGSNLTHYETFSLAAAREINSQPVTLACDEATVPGCDPFSTTGVAPIDNPTDLTTAGIIPQNLQVISTYVDYPNPPGSPIHEPLPTASGFIDMIGFVQSLGATTNGTYQNGAQTISLVYLKIPLPTGASPAAGAYITPGYLKFAQDACIGLSDGQRTAEIDIGVNNNANQSQLSVNVKQLGSASTPPCP